MLFSAFSWFLTALPPVLALVALGIQGLDEEAAAWKDALIRLEVCLLLSGVVAFACMRLGRWERKAAVRVGADVVRDFQPAAQLLGESPSATFPHMALWRAAQVPTTKVPCHSPENAAMLDRLYEPLSKLILVIRRKSRASGWIEWGSAAATVLAVAGALGGHVWLYFYPNPDAHWVEVALLWLPSLIAAIHSWSFRNHVADKARVLEGLATQLEFLRDRMLPLLKWSPEERAEMAEQRHAMLRLLCRVIGQYCQAELRFALGRLLAPPV